jgi:hypothetical protein
MEVVSVGPLRVASVLWQKGPQAWVLTVACKATFELAPGSSPLADEQLPIQEADGYWGEDPARSLHSPSDLAPVKPRADVVLVGSAFAPDGTPVRSLIARLSVSGVEKSIECFADRVVAADDRVQEGAGFSRMSLLYERAAGGPGTTNPVGVRRGARDGYGRIALPNLLALGTRVGRDALYEPVGFGPIAPHWPQRTEKLGRLSPAWPPADWMQRPLPADVDLGYFNAAPPDQQVAVLRDDERIVLENLHHEHPRLVTTLPGIHPACFVRGRGGSPFRVPMQPDTLRIDTDLGTATLTWRRQVPLERPEERGHVLIAMEQPGQKLTWAEVSALAPHADDNLEIETIPPAPPEPAARGASAERGSLRAPPPPSLPFNTATGLPASPAVTTPARPSRPPATQTVVFATSGPRTDAALPFQAAAKAAAPAAGPPAKGPPAGISSPWATSVQVGTAAREPEPPAVAIAPPSVARPPIPAMLPSVVESPISARQPIPSGLSASPWASSASAPSFEKAVAPVPVAPAAEPWGRPSPVAAEQPAPRADEILELLWFDAESVPRMRRNRAWKPILTALEQRPVDRDLDDPALAAEPMEMEDRREVFEILANAAPEDAGGVDRALDAAVRKDGKFVAQLAMFAGQIELRFDELSALKATVATAAPFVTPTDEALKTAVESAKGLLEGADELTPPSLAEAATKRVREAFAAPKRAVPETHLADQTDRVLLTQRRYEKRVVFGGAHLRCLLRMEGTSVPAYLPESLAKKLPMYQRFGVRLVAEVHQQADQYESYHASLRVVALARATPRRAREVK